jgi:S1-C subfamily serine protease
MSGSWLGPKGSVERVLLMVGLTVGLLGGTLLATATGVLAGPVSPSVSVLGATAVRVPASVVRLAGEVTVSVDSKGCAGPLLGSGVVTSGGLLVTAAHVAGGAEHVTVVGSSGGTTASPVLVAPGIDVASAPVPATWPSVRQATADPAVGAGVVVATRARGVLVVRTAHVQTYLRGTGPGDPTRVMRLDVGASPGDSGGAVLDPAGRLVGIVYASQHVTAQALVIPTSEVSAALSADGSLATC